MSFYWPDYHRLAQQLLNTPEFLSVNYEATLRTVISRSYYAVFKVVFNYLRDFEQISVPRGVNVHWFVINYMKNSQDNIKKVIGGNLDRLRFLRNLADYEDNLYNQLNKANQALSLAETIFEDMRNITI